MRALLVLGTAALLTLTSTSCRRRQRVRYYETGPVMAQPAYYNTPNNTTPPSVAPGTQPLSGDGWAMAVPLGWTVGTDNRGVQQWRGERNQWNGYNGVLSVEILRGNESLESLIASAPAAYRARGSTVQEPQRFILAGRRSVEFIVNRPAQVQQYPLFMAIVVDGRRGLVISCGGEPSESIERLCRGVIASTWFGSDDSQPDTSPPAGMKWLGERGRFVHAPEDWSAMPSRSAQRSVGVADQGEHHALVLNFLDELRGTPAQAIEGGRRGFANDSANTIVRTTPIQQGSLQGLLIDGTRASVTHPATTVFQWVVPAGPGTHYLITLAGPTSDVTAHPDRYRAILQSFSPTR